MANAVPKVLVTGASGYIATHCIKQLLEGGKYAVRGTVRSLQKEEKVRPLRELAPSPAIPLELVEADLLKEETWPSAVEGCQYVLHVASPFVVNSPRDEMELIRPAVEGTRNVLKACAEAGVKRVVLTSSVAAVSVGPEGIRGHGDEPYTEDDWSPEGEGSAYYKSKTLAERAAWDLLKELPEEKRFELAVINPTYVQGPLLSKASGEASASLVQTILGGQLPGVPELNFSLVDVRDVAAAHIAAMETPEAAGHRHILVAGNLWMREIALILQQEFQSQGYRIKTGRLPKFLMWIAGIFDATARSSVKNIGKVVTYRTDRMRSVLGINPIPMEQTLIEMAHSLIQYGLVQRKPGYSGAPSERGAGQPVDSQDQHASEGKDKVDQKEEAQPSGEGASGEDGQATAKGEVKPSTEEPKEEAQPSGTTSEEDGQATAEREVKPSTEELTEAASEPNTEDQGKADEEGKEGVGQEDKGEGEGGDQG